VTSLHSMYKAIFL